MLAAIVVLYHRDDRTFEQIAAHTGLSVHTVKKYLPKARARLRLELAAGSVP